MIVIVGCSAVGKTELVNRLLQDCPDWFAKCITHTTRPPRQGEQNGVDYHFVDHTTMTQDIEQGLFLETVTINGFQYGTSYSAIENVVQSGREPVLIVDIQGMENLLAYSVIYEHVIRFIWVETGESMEQLQARLVARDGDKNPETIHARMETSKNEMNVYLSTLYIKFDYVITNPDGEFEHAYIDLKSYLCSV